MIAACPKCSARYRIDRERLQAESVRLRCARCEAVFRVRAPESAPAEPVEPVEPTAERVAAAPAAPPPTPAEGPSTASPPASATAGTPAPVAPPVAAPAAEGGASPAMAQSSEAAPEVPDPTPGAKGERVLIAVPDAELGKQTAELLRTRGLDPIAVVDGVDAMLEIQRQLPRAVLLAADLPKMFGFQVCEVVKRNDSLRETFVVLAGAIHHPDRYRRPPEELYGADAYLEAPDLPDALLPLLERAGILLTPAPAAGPSAPAEEPVAAPAPAPEVEPPSLEVPVAPAAPAGLDAAEPPALDVPEPGALPAAPEAPPPAAPEAPLPAAPEAPLPAAPEAPLPAAPEAVRQRELPPAAPSEPAARPAPMPQGGPAAEVASPPPTADPLADERGKAERLARIIVSDIVLYNEEKFAEAVRAGNVAEVMDADLSEGRTLFDERIDARVRAKGDLLMEELLRVARARGMQ